MNEFTNSFWSLYISIITLVGILACVILLWKTAKKKLIGNSDNTTGHIWDENLKEMNNPLPLWWVGLFVITIIFGLAYVVIYPGLGSYQGSLKWSSKSEYDADVAQANQALKSIYDKFDQMPVQQVAGDPKALAIGEHLFMNQCAQCHGSDARGSKGFPNLSDSDWLHGGSPEKIKESITKGRNGLMPPMATAVGAADEVSNVANYVLSLSQSPHDTLKANLGRSKFAACTACHGMDGKGNTALGAPNLTDKIWLHGWGEPAIAAMINGGKLNQMPAQEERLTTSQIHILTAYVWGLSNKSVKVPSQ